MFLHSLNWERHEEDQDPCPTSQNKKTFKITNLGFGFGLMTFLRFARLMPATSGSGSTSGPTIIKGGCLAEFPSGRGPAWRAAGRVNKPQKQLSGNGQGASGSAQEGGNPSTRLRLSQPFVTLYFDSAGPSPPAPFPAPPFQGFFRPLLLPLPLSKSLPTR